jgi:predicted site-specific integrase-resolvase
MDNPIRRLTQKELARRWGVSHRTTERWRCQGKGPAFIKLCGRVIYRIEDIEAFELANLRQIATSGRIGQ